MSKKPIQLNSEYSSKIEKLEKDLDPANQEVDFKIPKVSDAIGKRIAKARMDKKLSQLDLAKKISINVADIKGIENGTAINNSKLINKICQYLKITQK